MRLGLVLAEIGTRQNVQVTDQEVNQAIMQEARNYPGQERQVFEFYHQEPRRRRPDPRADLRRKGLRPDLLARHRERRADQQGRPAEGRGRSVSFQIKSNLKRGSERGLFFIARR